MAMAVAMIIVILVISRGVRRREGENADRTRNGAHEIVFHERLLPTFCHAGRTFARLLVSRKRMPKEADLMDNTTLLIILILVLLLFGGGWYGRGRWY